MPAIDFTQPFPDYVTCPHCGEPEVEVWCYELAATCHACGYTFDHSIPTECEDVCSDDMRARGPELPQRPLKQRCGVDS
jgi:rubredoxin